MRIVVTGAQGQLGKAIVHECSQAHEVVSLSHRDLDVTSDVSNQERILAARPDAVVNCAAYNEVDAAEDHPMTALAVNALAVRSLSRAAERAGAVFVHYSSDFVFDGAASTPYTEDDTPNPLSMYGVSKLIGEHVSGTRARWFVLRVESLFGRIDDEREKGTVAAIRRDLAAGKTPRVFEDRVVSPSYIPDVAAATRILLESKAPPGTYHCVNSGSCTWVELAHELARRLGVPARIDSVRVADVVLRASRPRYCALSNQKLARAGIPMPQWQDAIERYIHASVQPRLGEEPQQVRRIATKPGRPSKSGTTITKMKSHLPGPNLPEIP